MDKKEYLLTVLDHLEPNWNLAKWLKLLITKWNLDDNMLEVIRQAVERAINTTKWDYDFVELKKSLKN